MADGLIQWPRAKYWQTQWNYAIGCSPVSPACENCWAKAWAKRFKQRFTPHVTKQEKPPKHGVCFVGNLTDCFGEWCDRIAPPEQYIGLAACPKKDATYLWLTKRPERMVQALNGVYDTYPYPIPFRDMDMSNQWFGFTAENQEWFDRRMGQTVGVPPWSNLWLSAEPLLGPMEPIVGSVFKWVVVGCESGGNRRPCKVEWVERIVQICMDNHVPVFVKQLEINGKCETDINKFPEHLRIRQVPWTQEGERK